MSRSSRIASILIVGVALAGGLAPAAPENADPNVALAREELKVIDLAFKDIELMKSGGELGLSDPKLLIWGQRKIDALRATKASKEEVIVALTEHLERMKKNEAYVNHAHQAGEATRLDIRDAQYRRIDAEIQLNREKAR